MTPSEDLTPGRFPYAAARAEVSQGHAGQRPRLRCRSRSRQQTVSVAAPGHGSRRNAWDRRESGACGRAAESARPLRTVESFLINFVVEQTGYPAEVVDLDADLEADLGIDSIKKAQLFGELQEYFDVTPSEDLSLDDFPTLRHVLNFLLQGDSGQGRRLQPSKPVADRQRAATLAAPGCRPQPIRLRTAVAGA